MALSFSSAHELLLKPKGLSASHTREVLTLLASGTLAVEQGATLLKSWAERGETGTELCATVEFLRDHALLVPVAEPCLDVVGTGGSQLNRYNVSTTVAFVAAAAQIPVAKHGNRGSLRQNGSFDLLDELGIPFELSPDKIARLQKETGVCFIFARTHHPIMAQIVAYRRAAGGRTIFNLAGPLSNPAHIKHQLIGTTNAGTAQVVADALRELKTSGALVVWGAPSIDEISITGATGCLQVSNQQIHVSSLHPPKAHDVSYDALPGGDAPENARTFFRLLSGEEKGPLLDMVVENAGAAFDLWHGRAPEFGGEGSKAARQIIRSGAALAKFEEHRDLALELAH